MSDTVDNNSIKKMKQLFTEIFANFYKKTCELYKAHEKSISYIITENNKALHETLDKLSAEIQADAVTLKQLTDKIKKIK